ncbi:unnamed protein product [Ixodes pacificus]
MMNRPLSFFFFTLQIVQSSVLAESSGIAASTLFTFPEIYADTAESSCPVTACPPCADYCDHVPSPDHLIGTFETTLTTPTSGTDASRPPLRPFVFRGLGGSMMNRPLSFFFFALQVGFICEPYCLRSDNRFLLRLPCPLRIVTPCSSLLDWLRVCLTLLIRSGDVEMNPGPDEDTQALLKQILEGQAKIAADITQIKCDQASLQTKLDGFEERLTVIDSNLSQLPAFDNKLWCLEDRIVALEVAVAQLTDKNEDLENQSRRNNLILYGLEEADNESPTSLLN